MLRAVVLCSALFTAPSWYQSLVSHTAPVQPSFARFVIAMPIAFVLLLILKTVATAGSPAADPQRTAGAPAATEQLLPQPAVVDQRTTTENSPRP